MASSEGSTLVDPWPNENAWVSCEQCGKVQWNHRFVWDVEMDDKWTGVAECNFCQNLVGRYLG